MRIEFRRLTDADRDRVRRAVLADMEERDGGIDRREWIRDTFDAIRRDVIERGESFDLTLSYMIAGPQIRRHNRRIQEMENAS